MVFIIQVLLFISLNRSQKAGNATVMACKSVLSPSPASAFPEFNAIIDSEKT